MATRDPNASLIDDSMPNHDLFRDTDNIKSESGTPSVLMPQYSIVMRDGTNIGLWDGVTNSEAIGVLMEEVQDLGEQAIFWTGGHFHQHKLEWPVAVDSIDKRKAVFDGKLLAAS